MKPELIIFDDARNYADIDSLFPEATSAEFTFSPSEPIWKLLPVTPEPNSEDHEFLKSCNIRWEMDAPR